MKSRLGVAGLTLVAVVVVGVALAALLWGAIFGLIALLAVTVVVGFIARELVGGRSSIELVFVSGAVGSVPATLLVPVLGLPAFFRFAGVPVLWAIAGAAAAIAIAGTLSPRRSA